MTRRELLQAAVASMAFPPNQLLSGRPDQAAGRHVVALIAEDEYETARTLPEFIKQELEPRGLHRTVVEADGANKDSFPGLDALKSADLLFVSVRRRTPRKDQMAILRQYIAERRPVVAIRTASHAFAREDPPAGHETWPGFDREVLGGEYNGYDSIGRKTGSDIWADPAASAHPALRGLEGARFHSQSWIYRMRSLARSVQVLLRGRWPENGPVEAVAWAYEQNGMRSFYTSLGHPGDFQLPEFRLLLVNAVYWALRLATPGSLVFEAESSASRSEGAAGAKSGRARVFVADGYAVSKNSPADQTGIASSTIGWR